MAVASIKSTRNGDPTTSLVDSSREDLADGDVITLESIGVGAITHSWSILFAPHFSAVGLTSTNTAVTQFAVDKEGSYLIRLMVDAGLPTESSQYLRFRALTEFAGLQLVAAGERRDEEAIIPTDIGIYGWAYEQNGNLRKILEILKPIAMSGRVVHVDSNLGTQGYGDFATIQEAIDFSVLDGASESQPYVVLINEGVYEETLTLQPFVHLVGTQHKSTQDVPDLTAKPKLSPRVVVRSEVSHDATLTVNSELTVLVGLHFLCEVTTANPMFAKTGEGVLQANACTFESTAVTVGQGALIDLQEGRFVGLDCRFRMDETGDIGNFAFLQSGEDTTSLLDSCVFTAPSCLAINPNQHNVGGVINVLRDCIVSSAQYGLATNGTSTVINSSLRNGVENISVNWLGSSYGVSNSGNSEQTILFSEIEGDIYWNKDNTNHNNVLKVGAVVFETLNESGTGSAISVVALANALSISFDSTVSSMTSTNVQEAILELEGLLGNKIESAVNIGTGEGVFKQKTGTDLELRSILGTGGVSVALSGTGDELEISYTGAGLSNQINQDDSSVVVTDTGVTATIDFNVNGTNEWRIDGVGDLLSMNSRNLGNTTDKVERIYTNYIGDSTNRVVEAWVDQLWVNNTNTIHLFDPTDNSVDIHIKADTTGVLPRLKIGDTFCVGIPDQSGNDFGALQPAAMGGLTANSTIFHFDYTGNGKHLFSEPSQGQAQLVFGTHRIPILDMLSWDDAHDTILSSDDAHDLLMYDPTTGRFITKGRNTLDLPYANLTGKPVALSEFTNDVGFLTSVGSIDYQTISNTPNNLSEFNNDLTISYNALSNRPTIFDGNYASLTGTPTIPTKLSELQNDSFFGDEIHFSVAPTEGQGLFYDQATDKWVPTNQSDIVVDYAKLENKPVLFSGDYNDLSSLPNLFDGAYSSLTGKPTLVSGFTNDAGYLTTVGDISYDNLTDKPTLFDGNYSSLTGSPLNLSDFANDEEFLSRSGTFAISSINVSELVNDAQYISSVDYADITNTPSIPTNVSEFTNDSGYLTEVGTISYNDLTDKPTLFDSDYNSLSNQPSLFSGAYNDLTGKPTIPTQVNQLSFPSGSNGDVLVKDNADVEFVSKASLASELHIDDIYDDVIIVEATNGKDPIAQYGHLHLVRLIKENINLELPSATSVGIYRTITIKLVERVGEFTLTIKPATGEAIDTSTNSIVWGGGELLRSMTLYSDGSNWWII